ncbi:MAG: hypothetical protein KC590_02480 [Nitrospira sp.]|nr:hypothetical protein [Nitrospira sp.]
MPAPAIIWLFPFLLTVLTGTLSLFTGSDCLAQEGSDSLHPPVFQPDETQHGFAEFDTLPDFFEDDIPAPYDSYSDDPTLPPKDQKPGGLFEALNFAESVDEDQSLRKGHILVPIHPTESFPQHTKAVHLVFKVFKHYAPYQVIGRLFPEQVPGLDDSQWLDEDIADLALEDESGYLKFFPSSGTWLPGRYRVDLYVGYIVNSVNKMGAMRFTIEPTPPSSTPPASSS